MSLDPEDYVVGWGGELDLSEDAIDLAREYAIRAWYEYPVNRSKRVIAAASLYLSGLYANEKRTQEEIKEVSGVTHATITDAYRDILQYEDPHAFEVVQPEAKSDESATGRLSIPIPHIKGFIPVLLSMFVVIGFLALMLSNMGMHEVVDASEFEQVGSPIFNWFTGLALALTILIAGLFPYLPGGEWGSRQ